MPSASPQQHAQTILPMYHDPEIWQSTIARRRTWLKTSKCCQPISPDYSTLPFKTFDRERAVPLYQSQSEQVWRPGHLLARELHWFAPAEDSCFNSFSVKIWMVRKVPKPTRQKLNQYYSWQGSNSLLVWTLLLGPAEISVAYPPQGRKDIQKDPDPSTACYFGALGGCLQLLPRRGIIIPATCTIYTATAEYHMGFHTNHVLTAW